MTAPDPLRIQKPSSSNASSDFDWELDQYVATYENAAFKDPNVDLEFYLPNHSHPRFVEIALELMRVDMEIAYDRGEARTVDLYLNRFSPLHLSASGDEIEASLQSEWERLRKSSKQNHGSESDQPFLRGNSPFPNIGDTVCGFEIFEEIGRGAFSRVFLANELQLSSRKVVLKVASQFPFEADILSRLQHKNIVPIYSIHQFEQFHVVCMPFLGRATLAELLRTMSETGSQLNSGRALISTLHGRNNQTLKSLEPHGTDSKSLDRQSTELQTCESERNSFVTQSTSFTQGLSRSLVNEVSKLSPANAATWICLQLAEGLDHAHQRGILHRDIKPANVLLTEDGLPMLLDFNLAAHESDGLGTDQIGGTLRYMSPEQLLANSGLGQTKRKQKSSAIEGEPKDDTATPPKGKLVTTPEEVGTSPVDARSDVYSLGIVFFELLFGHPPFPDRKGDWNGTLAKMAEDRSNFPTIEIHWGRGITPALIAILRKMIAPDPKSRYQIASQLVEDLRAHSENRPLPNTHSFSIQESILKWGRRHPQWTSGGAITAVAAILLSIGAAAYLWRVDQLKSMEARQWALDSSKIINDARGLLAGSVLPKLEMEQRIAECTTAIEKSRTVWKSSNGDNLLSELHFLRANGYARLARLSNNYLKNSSDSDAKSLLDKAIHDTRIMEAKATNPSRRDLAAKLRQLLEQSAELESSTNEPIAGLANQESQRKAIELRMSEIRDLDEEIRLARIAAQEEGNHAPLWLSLAELEVEAGDLDSAMTHAEIANQIDPDLVWCDFLKAAIRLSRGEFKACRESLDRVVESLPNLPEARMNRAIALLGLGDPAAAIQDLNAIEDRAVDYPRLYFIREEALRRLGRIADAESSRLLGINCRPTDALSWNARGEARLRSQPPQFAEALEDIQTALQLDPHMRKAIENVAAIQTEMNRIDDALATLNTLVERYPDYALGWTSRSVLKARKGSRASAMQDIEKGLSLDRSPLVCYQAASALAILEEDEEAKSKVLSLLRETIRKEEVWALSMLQDPDLHRLKDSPELLRLVEAAKELMKP